MLFKFVAAKWALEEGLVKARAFEGDYTLERALEFNQRGLNVYFFPNHPADYNNVPFEERTDGKKKRRKICAADIDTFEYCFVDLDMKDYQNENADRRHDYETKQEFVDELLALGDLQPTTIIDSGNGVHAYWRVLDLDPMGFLRLNRRLCRRLRTDPAVSLLTQIMRVPGTLNVKQKDQFKPCEILHESEAEFTAEQMHLALPAITVKDEEYCQRTFDAAYNPDTSHLDLIDELPVKFLTLCKESGEIKNLFYEPQKDRSTADFRLAHLLFAKDFTAGEAMSVLYNTSKACERAGVHRYNYAKNTVDKIWTFEAMQAKGDSPAKVSEELGEDVADILARVGDEPAGARFACSELVDATEIGFRLTHVLGLIGGQGNGKTSVSLNLFKWFVERNPDYIHVFVSLEMPPAEIAQRWAKLCGKNKALHSKVHIVGNYDADGTYRHLSLSDIQEYVLDLEKKTGKKVGCVVIDHIGIVKKEKTPGEFGGILLICEKLKAFAVATNTFLVIQSQTSRQKNAGGDTELDADAAYGTAAFEWYVDWLMTTWQPLKRIYDDAPHMTYTAFKFPKLRHKNHLVDRLKENTVYALKFEPNDGSLRAMTSDELEPYNFWNLNATKLRNRDRKRDPSAVKLISWVDKAKQMEAQGDKAGADSLRRQAKKTGKASGRAKS